MLMTTDDNTHSNIQLATPPPEAVPLVLPFVAEPESDEPDTLPPTMQPAPLIRRPSSDLFECIEQYSFLTEDQARHVFKQIASAVAHLHQLRIVHRDIKDENLLIDSNFNVKLIDFGSAAFIPAEPDRVFDRFLGYGTVNC